MNRNKFLQLMACSPILVVPGSAGPASSSPPASASSPAVPVSSPTASKSTSASASPAEKSGSSLVLVEANRGNSIHAPENTLTAIEQAITTEVDRVEVDVMASNDGVPMRME